MVQFVILGVLLAVGVGTDRLLANGIPTREELEHLDLSGKSGVPPSNPLMMAMLHSLQQVWFYAMYGDRHAIAQATKYMATFTGKYLEFLERLPRQKSMGSRMKRRVRELSDYAERKSWKPDNWFELNKRLVRWADTCTSCHLKFRDPDPEWFHGLPVVLKLIENKAGNQTRRKADPLKMAMLGSLELMWFYAVYSDLLAIADTAKELSSVTERYVKALDKQPRQKTMALEMKRRLKAVHNYAEEQGWEAENTLEMNRRLLALANSCTSCHVKFRDPNPKWFQGFPVVVKLVYPEPEHPERVKDEVKGSAQKPGDGRLSPAPTPGKGGVKSLWD
ncbi:MAG: hypothetical protein ACE5NC_08235 [Anaerolineae bacterium]